MLISTKGRYALRVMVALSESAGTQLLPLKELSAKEGISAKYLEGIMADLSRARLVDASHGKGGGYRLSRPPQEYTAYEILSAAEGDLAPVSCLSGGAVRCENASTCRTLPVYAELGARIREYLSSVTLSDLAGLSRTGEYVI